MIKGSFETKPFIIFAIVVFEGLLVIVVLQNSLEHCFSESSQVFISLYYKGFFLYLEFSIFVILYIWNSLAYLYFSQSFHPADQGQWVSSLVLVSAPPSYIGPIILT